MSDQIKAWAARGWGDIDLEQNDGDREDDDANEAKDQPAAMIADERAS